MKLFIKPFTVKPKNWWSYLNPGWWRRKKIIEALIEHEWNSGLQEKVAGAVADAVLYGKGRITVDWKND